MYVVVRMERAFKTDDTKYSTLPKVDLRLFRNKTYVVWMLFLVVYMSLMTSTLTSFYIAQLSNNIKGLLNTPVYSD